MNEDHKNWIDSASYEDLLRKWRFAETGDPLLQGETGDYFKKIMGEKRVQVGDGGHVAASKRIGWIKP